MYRWIRDIHLLAGLFALPFLLMYGLSAVQMSHNTWFSMKPAVSENAVALPAGAADARSLARRLMDERGLRGELAQVRKSDSGWSFRIVRPGTVYEVEYAFATGQTRIRTSRANFMGMMNRIHHVGGVWHEYALTNAWGVFVGLISVLLMVSGLTGIYLWFKLYSERVIGGILLGLGLGWGLGLVVLIRAL